MTECLWEDIIATKPTTYVKTVSRDQSVLKTLISTPIKRNQQTRQLAVTWETMHAPAPLIS